MTSKNVNDGGPAFPYEVNGYQARGMSLRDYFAGQALTGLALRASYGEWLTKHLGRICYEYADALLEARGEDR